MFSSIEHGLGDAGFPGVDNLNIQCAPNRRSDFYADYAAARVAAENGLSDIKGILLKLRFLD